MGDGAPQIGETLDVMMHEAQGHRKPGAHWTGLLPGAQYPRLQTVAREVDRDGGMLVTEAVCSHDTVSST
jgi:hypothetical protein